VSGLGIDQRDLNNLYGAMKRVEKKMRVVGFDLIKETSVLFAISASKATPKGRNSLLAGADKLPAKAKFRKVVRMSQKAQNNRGKFFYINTHTNKIVSSTKVFKLKERRRRNLEPITKFLEAYDTRSGKPYYIPLKPHQDETDVKYGKIPKAGSGKFGWIRALAKLKNKSVNTGDISNRVNATRIVKKSENPFIKMTNNVKYISKIAPSSAKIGIQKASRALEQKFLPKAERLIQKEIKK